MCCTSRAGWRSRPFPGSAFPWTRASASPCTGPSGAGKSTLLRALYGNYLPTGGSIRVRCGGEDVDITSADPRTVIRLRRGCISYVSQFLRVIPRVSTLDLVAEPLLEAGEGQAAARSRAEGLLARLNLPNACGILHPPRFPAASSSG